MGIVDVVSEFCYLPSTQHRHIKKHKQLQTVEMRVRMDCEGCVRKVKKALEGMKGVSSVSVEPKQFKVTVIGYVDPAKVMRRVAYKTGKKVEPWPYVPYDLVAHPYAPGAYDKKAPAGHVRNVVADPAAAPLARASSLEEKYSSAFSDENPNACSVM
ncbi:heavy metal-associated isoprenylated plant protein 27-like [Ananas comosus]|uniref:Heavy metal-associated isoprenylated plant protein 27-like n=1 Tax=Ananas comosus TaxID=4615 RepID=A0A6P5EPY3_ANACO|nr:heavy metal-associated isoprenylated plant protein 27-like [Ananas comosus]